jgi:demethylmenaquinone methyltransferase/2-methoxy-6-polyprenyl-1,4-benzoquinol methylase
MTQNACSAPDDFAPTANPEVVEMFNRISQTYDRLNRVFSMGVDRFWRRSAVRALALQDGMKILDCSAGTGDMSFEAVRQCAGVEVTLLDPAEQMLEIGRVKAEKREIRSFCFEVGAAEKILHSDGEYDRFMVAFGIRNFANLRKGLEELARVTKSGGRGVVLEFTPDRSALVDKIFRAYMWRVMRPVGGAWSKEKSAYAYLARTIQNFPTTPELITLFAECGFARVEAKPLSFGIATQFLLVK